MPNLFPSHVAGDTLPASDWQAAWNLVEATFGDIGPLIISGLVHSAGAGLSVSVTAGTAVIGGEVIASGSFTIAGLTPSTTNHIYFKQDGTGTANTTGTQPANSVKLGTAVTGASTVTSVATNWASGRQSKVRTESLVHGIGAGHPRAVDLASWHATNNEGNETKGTLPAGSLPSISLDTLSDVNLPSASQGDILYRNATEWVRLTAGTNGQVLKTSGAAANPSWAADSVGVTASTGAEASHPGSPATGDLFLPNDGFQIERYSGSVWVPWGPIFPLTAPDNSAFSWVNQGSSTVTTTQGGIVLAQPAGGASTSASLRVKTAPSTPYTATFFMLANTILTKQWLRTGVVFRESSTGKFVSFHISNGQLWTTKWSSATGISADYSQFGLGQVPNWIQITDNGTNLVFRVSQDGQTWTQIESRTRTDYLAGGPNQIGFFVAAENVGTPNFDASLSLLSYKET